MKRGTGEEEEIDKCIHLWSEICRNERAWVRVSIFIRKPWRNRMTNWEFV